ncbi:uncharacterized protein TRIADDRAFT_22754 [Trichoplax adhaerens]|uniref:Peptide-N(4)-(N-acetyl-beta-glucosaminyl)asparagine amidase n=1 Tax=Trichoplax adhaerens TaxID=10228 RepID=B3RRV6_TRIAD|nr:hypothetical protein TRIADDRAFT_22754 [Trichoplax adhaerens]EDV26937.1 hypothetical protein TRIADDRAFT_22754 [Trichoplax adhaerens]|eukprot:XP_002110933.1 hypothetical protein TRIADDRAFT_22754 [Trichoplax adhaerens]
MVHATVIRLIEKNSGKVFDDASYAILRYTSNILKEPEIIKFRKIKTTNDIFKNRILPADGAIECLLAMGFRQEDGNYILPLQYPLHDLTDIHQSLINERTRRNLQLPPLVATPALTPSNLNQASQQAPPREQLTSQLARSEEAFYAKLETWSQQVMVYEQKDSQAKALSVIPVDDLRSKAIKLSEREIDGAAGPDQSDQIIMDYLLLELLHWFKNNFFSWVDQPPCNSCGGQTSNIGNAPPTTDDLKWGASRVEAYKCTICGLITRFPRFNHPSKLLDTREGRCGEWANCFTLCCRAMGFEARLVIDWTDHVWTEVFSNRQQRWLHCDPCEDACDKPLLYEIGWGKKLTYVIAFSSEQVVDVTWRYTAKSEEVRQRRQECRETWLTQAINSFNRKLQSDKPTERVQLLQLRSFAEILEFLAPKQTDGQGYGGRVSGSLAWRQSRGETKNASSRSQSFVFEPNEKDISDKKFRLRYCPSTDVYVHSNDDVHDKVDELSGWDNYTYEANSLFRKVEHDWKMVYLARIEGTNSASLTWKIDLSKASLAVKSISVFASTAIYEDGQVIWTIKGENGVQKSWAGGKEVIECPEVHDCQEVTLTAFLSGGKGDVAWQHTQLFRQSINNKNEYLLDIQLELKSC